ncbi:CUE domain-containing protein [Arthrobacter sp. B2a2-09]|uniref:CUE domain-containing protein n=1 Tax=Arthrobacter sp. B2a2-09 TaxID=2952822 RepID=UPI0022CD52D9|nr:CUE domain-containing protein [Arthrobacter sp. B2a2-09]MCZ9880580.1 CUE domain-containing protein [Arthrobacter sp. B2a2-09]
MTREDEARALVAVINNLAERFPDMSRSDIETVVAEEHGNLNGGPIRDYVPLLVEHAAKKRLTKMAAEIQASGGSSSVLVGKQQTVDRP